MRDSSMQTTPIKRLGDLYPVVGEWLVMAFVAAIVTLMGWRFGPNDPLLLFDSNAYVGGAQSLAEGRGYRLTGFVGQPVVGIYPPGQSAFLSLVWRHGVGLDGNLNRMRLLQGAASVLGLALAGGILRRGGIPLPFCLLGVVNLGMGLTWVWMTQKLMSDIPCMAWIFGAMLPWVGVGEVDWRRKWPTWAWTGFAVGMAGFWRVASLPFAAVLGLAAILAACASRSWVPMASSLGLVPLLTSRWMTRGGLTYQDSFELWKPFLGDAGFQRELLQQNLWMLCSGNTLGGAVSGVWTSGLGSLARQAGLGAGFAAWGVRTLGFGLLVLAVRSFLRDRSPVQLGLGVAVAGCVASVGQVPFDLRLFISERYLMPVVPLVLLWAWRGLPVKAAWFGRPSIVPFVWGAVVAMLGAGVLLLRARDPSSDRRHLEGVREASNWIRTQGAPGPVAVGVDHPFAGFHETCGRMMIADYLEPAVQVYMPVFVLHRQQGHAKARYAFVLAGDPRLGRVDLPWKKVFTSSSGYVNVFEVDPDDEARWRVRRGIPPPTL